MKVHILIILFSVLCWSGCDQLPLADNRARPEPPALPAEMIMGDPFVNLTARKMNVVYVGIPNPLDLQATGVNLDNLTIMATPPGYITEYGKSFNLNVSTPGIQTVKVRQNGKLLNEFTFRAKPVPDPQTKLGNHPSGKISAGDFKAQNGVIAVLNDFDFDVRCAITGYKVTRISPPEEPVEALNRGGKLETDARGLTLLAAPRDIYMFTNIRATCPGDKIGRELNPLVFEIL